MTDEIPEAEALAAFAARDRAYDGRFVVAVTSTGIYCRPSCPARRPKPEHVRLLATNDAAERQGFRPCRRCRPDAAQRDEVAIAEAIRLIEAADAAPRLDALATAVGYAPHHFHRLFRRATGITPAGWWRGVRGARLAAALEEGSTVTDATYAAGYAAPSRLYADAPDRLGMAPAASARGGAGEAIRWTVGRTSYGPIVLGATDRGICWLAFDRDERMLRARFPAAVLSRADDALGPLLERAIAAVEDPARTAALPLDLRGTAFQRAVWAALATIPPGESLSYAALAARAGHPQAVRAVGTACGANPVSVLIPCHRARRGDGSPGGYAWGLDVKAELLRREGWSDGTLL